MRIKNLNNRAFSLLEILLSAIIFVITIGGIFATLNAVRSPVANKESALTAAVFGKQVLEVLRSQVNDPTYYGTSCTASCATFDLELGSHSVTLPTSGLNWPTAAMSTANSNVLNYKVSCADGSSSPCTNAEVAHRVVLNINY